MEVFLYLLDMYIDFQFILSSCGCIGNKCMVGVGLLLPRRTKSFVPVLLIPAHPHPGQQTTASNPHPGQQTTASNPPLCKQKPHTHKSGFFPSTQMSNSGVSILPAPLGLSSRYFGRSVEASLGPKTGYSIAVVRHKPGCCD